MHFLLKNFKKANRLLGLDLVDSVIWKRNKSLRGKASNTIRVGVVGSGSPGEPASVYIKTCDHSTSIFNCGDGTFRLCYAKFFKFRFVQNIFCTQSSWQCVGGIPSVGKAVYDKNCHFPTVHGPMKISECLDQFAAITDLDPSQVISTRQFNTESYFEDSNIEIEFIKLMGSAGTEVFAYLCRLKSRKGRLHTEQLIDRNIPMHFIHDLQDNRSITLSDGTVINPSDVRRPGFPGGNFLLIDVPSEEFLANLSSNEQLNSFLDLINQSECGMEFVMHFTPPKIIDSPEYKAFMRRSKAKRHLAINESNQFSSLHRVHRLQNSLNQLDSDIFPLLSTKVDETPVIYSNVNEISENPSDDSIHIELVSDGTEYIFLSKRNEERTGKDDTEDEDESSDDQKDEDFIDNTSNSTSKSNESISRHKLFPKIVFFGTGSSFSGVTRNVTSILVHTSPDSSILLDCGEGTAGQIYRFYGERSAAVFQNIKAIFISHMHGDHHVGFLDFLQMRKKFVPNNRSPLLLMAPKHYFSQLLDFYNKHFDDFRSEYTIIDNEDLINSSLSPELMDRLKITELQTCLVPHIDASYAISIKSKSMPDSQSEFKVTFSGDTIPCDELIKLGRDSTLLIHEATLEDSLAVSAAMKKHSTISQAIEQGEKMNAKYTILTHFSQRYQILPSIYDELGPNVGVAFDNMELVESDLCKLSELYSKIKDLFSVERDRIEARTKRYKTKYDILS